jgi:hypothetical protein
MELGLGPDIEKKNQLVPRSSLVSFKQRLTCWALAAQRFASCPPPLERALVLSLWQRHLERSAGDGGAGRAGRRPARAEGGSEPQREEWGAASRQDEGEKVRGTVQDGG